MAEHRQAKVIECGVCYETFASDGIRMPMLLSCGHSVCQGCSANLGSRVVCPFDMRSSSIPPTKNFALADMLGGMAARQTKASQERALCTGKPHAEALAPPATVWCDDCDAWWCDVCNQGVHLFVSDHEPIPAEERAMQLSVPMCREHGQKKTLMCMDDGVMICVLCRDTAKHAGHRSQLVTNVCKTLRDALSADLDAVAATTRKLEALAAAVQAETGGIAGTEKSRSSEEGEGTRANSVAQIRASCDTLRRALDEREQTLTAAATACAEDKLKRLDRQRVECGLLLSHLGVAATRGHQVLHMNDADLCQAADDACMALRAAASLPVPGLVDNRNIFVSLPTESALGMIRKHGVVAIPPSSVTAVVRGANFEVSWAQSASQADYIVEMASDDGHLPFTEVYRGPELQAVIPAGDLHGRRVRFRVRSMDGLWSPEVSCEDATDGPASVATARDSTRQPPAAASLRVPLRQQTEPAAASIERQRCTFNATRKYFTQQRWYGCMDCFSGQNSGCCEVCARVCHAGHRLTGPHESKFFCDCGAGGGRRPCAALT